MSKLFAWLCAATLALCLGDATPAWAGDPLKPYVVLIEDTSGSMAEATTSGSPTCGGVDTKHNHARCAINRIVNSYGDMVFALGRFRMAMSGTTTAVTFPSGCSTSQVGCTAANGAADNRFELLSGLVDGNNQAASKWVDLTGNTCTATGTDPEIWSATGGTPLEGSLRGARRYWQGLQASDGTTTIWPNASPGFSPIVNDPLKDQFLPNGCDPSPTCTTNCCASQCRPYIVILLTDGDEQCFGTPANAAASLLATAVGGKNYRIQTRPIGFGKPPGDPEIEAIAHAGGAPDLPGVNEGFYASDEQGLQLAISAILKDAIKTEVCNNLDDDCDTTVDEGFPGKGNTCDNGQLGVCRTTGTQVCKADGTGVQCNAPPGPAPGTEVCNNLDDDCDGKVDEGVTGCTCSPQGEQCNNTDDDCDTRIDEGITRPCGTGTCQGIETCRAGGFENCTAPLPQAEVCNGLDDNCDGIRDGFTAACSTMTGGFPPFDPRNNPGDPSRNPIPENICHPGQRTCPANVGPPNAFGQCLLEQKPLPAEICNGLDDDCDNKIDEGTGGADCSSNCGVGKTVCVNGTLQCNSVPATDDETCNGIDDDCDTRIDENYVGGTPCGTDQVCNGHLECINGDEVCIGDPIGQESCNCFDDNCNGIKDDGALCSGGTACTHCQCAPPCDTGEFPCAADKVCMSGYCVKNVCDGVVCPDVNGAKQICRFKDVPPETPDQAECVLACDPSVIKCPGGQVCIPSTGECKPDDCTTIPEQCTASQSCVNGSCVTNPCYGVNCPSGQYCVAGSCYGTCADVECPKGERCRLGLCESDPCGRPCPYGKVCHDESGQCLDSQCGFVTCPTGQYCNPNKNGACEDDPCVGTACPNAGERCLGGTCYDPDDFAPDAAVEAHVTAGGGGGCATSSGSGLGLALALLAVRRRRVK